MNDRNDAPFLIKTENENTMMLWVLACLSILALLYSIFYDWRFIIKYILSILIGLGIETLYYLLKRASFKKISLSVAVTSSLLILSVPPNIPYLHLSFGLLIAIIFAKVSVGENTIRLNPMLTGRLFLMLVFNRSIVAYTQRGIDPDAVSSATVLDFYHSEGVKLDFLKILSGRVRENWEELYEIVPGSPGEIFTVIIIIMGVILFLKNIIDIKIGISFILSFTLSMIILKEPPIYHLFTGAIFFTAVFIATDPKTTPGSKAGRIIAGILAGVINALIRKFTYYSEAIVFTFLIINLLTPLIDKMTFYIKCKYLVYKKKFFLKGL